MRVRLRLLVLIGVAALASCTSDGSGELSTPGSDASASPTSAELQTGGGVDGPVAYAARIESDDSMSAEILGTLEAEGGCLYAAHDDHRYPVLWAHGTTWNNESSSVVLPDGTTLSLGAQVHGGGGYLYAHTLEAYIGNETAFERVMRCAEEPCFEVAVLQST